MEKKVSENNWRKFCEKKHQHQTGAKKESNINVELRKKISNEYSQNNIHPDALILET